MGNKSQNVHIKTIQKFFEWFFYIEKKYDKYLTGFQNLLGIKTNNTNTLEHQIDELVYKLYKLSYEEVLLIT